MPVHSWVGFKHEERIIVFANVNTNFTHEAAHEEAMTAVQE